MRDFDDDHDWYEDAPCPYCGRYEDCEHDGYDRDDEEEHDYYLDAIPRSRFDRTEAVAEKALARCGIAQDAEAWPEAFNALVRRLGEQADDPLAQRRPGWTVALPF